MVEVVRQTRRRRRLVASPSHRRLAVGVVGQGQPQRGVDDLSRHGVQETETRSDRRACARSSATVGQLRLGLLEKASACARQAAWLWPSPWRSAAPIREQLRSCSANSSTCGPRRWPCGLDLAADSSPDTHATPWRSCRTRLAVPRWHWHRGGHAARLRKHEAADVAPSSSHSLRRRTREGQPAWQPAARPARTLHVTSRRRGHPTRRLPTQYPRTSTCTLVRSRFKRTVDIQGVSSRLLDEASHAAQTTTVVSQIPAVISTKSLGGGDRIERCTRFAAAA